MSAQKQGSSPLSSFSFSQLPRQMRICSHLSPCDSNQNASNCPRTQNQSFAKILWSLLYSFYFLRYCGHYKKAIDHPVNQPSGRVLFMAMQVLLHWLGNNRDVCPIIAPDNPSEYRISKRLSIEPWLRIAAKSLLVVAWKEVKGPPTRSGSHLLCNFFIIDEHWRETLFSLMPPVPLG